MGSLANPELHESDKPQEYLAALDANWGAIGKAQAGAGILHSHVQYWRSHLEGFHDAENAVFGKVAARIMDRMKAGESVSQVRAETKLSIYGLYALCEKMPALQEEVKRQEATHPSELSPSQALYLTLLERNLGAHGKSAGEANISPSLPVSWRKNRHYKDEEDAVYKSVAETLTARLKNGEPLNGILLEAGISYMELFTGLGRREPSIREFLHEQKPPTPHADPGLSDHQREYLRALDETWGVLPEAEARAKVSATTVTRWRDHKSFETAETEAYGRIGERIIARLEANETLPDIYRSTRLTALSLAQGMGRHNHAMYIRIRKLAPVLPHNARYEGRTREYFLRTLRAQHGNFERTCDATGVSMHTLLYHWAHKYDMRMELNAAANEAAGRPAGEDTLMDMLTHAIMVSSGLKHDGSEQVLPRGKGTGALR